VDIRERLAFAGETLADGLRALHHHVEEGLILSTCNRTEIYVATNDGQNGHREIFDFLAGYHNVPMAILERASYTLHDGAAVRHLFKVASGLDSMVLGEPQILSQIRDALNTAREADSVGPMLQRLATDALRIGKRARTETDISRNRVSIAHAAVELINREKRDLGGLTAVVVGAGYMASLAAKLLAARGVGYIRIVNRSLDSAQRLADAVDGQAIPITGLAGAIAGADLVIAAVTTSKPMIVPDVIEERNRPLLLVDLSVPRTIDPACEHVPMVTTRDVDALESLAEEAREAYATEISKVELLVDDAVRDFAEWRQSRVAAKAIASVRQQAESIAEAELERVMRRLSHLSERDQNLVRMLASGITNKLLHEPVQAMRHAESFQSLRDIAASQGVTISDTPERPLDLANTPGE